MRPSLKALALLLAYPTAEVQEALPDIRLALAADAAIAPVMGELDALLDSLRGDTMDVQEAYVGRFDRTRSLCLNLFEHVHGDSRERGPAMVELAGIYREAGLEPSSAELPDHLPTLLEYAAVEPGRGLDLLANAAPVLDLLHGRLLARDCPYAGALHAVLLLAGARPGAVPASEEMPETPEELDASYEEAAVTFGPGSDPAAECGVDVLSAKLRAATRRPLNAPSPAPARRPVIRHVAAASQG